MSDGNDMWRLDEERVAKAFDALCAYLSPAPHSERECRDRLYAKGFRTGEIQAAIDKAKRYRYIDDEEYVRSYIASYSSRYGKRLIFYKLTHEKGVDGRLAANLLEDLLSDDMQRELCESLAKKHMRRGANDRSEAHRLSTYLYQKGFDFDMINSVLSDLFDEYED